VTLTVNATLKMVLIRNSFDALLQTVKYVAVAWTDDRPSSDVLYTLPGPVNCSTDTQTALHSHSDKLQRSLA